MNPTPEQVAHTRTLIVQAARKGERAPANLYNGGTLYPPAVRFLCDSGWMRIEVSGKNFRRIFILKGPHAGCSTAPDPHGGTVYRLIPQDRDEYARKCAANHREREARYRARVFA